MNLPARLTCLLAITFLGACAGPAHLITLDEAGPRPAKNSPTPSVAVVRADVPLLIDRPQLVLRGDRNKVTISESYRWAEPLRHDIPRVVAGDLGELLDSKTVAAEPTEAGGFSFDFKLLLDFQQFDAVLGQGADVDVLWRVERRGERPLFGRGSFRQPLAGAPDDPAALVAAQRQALRRVAEEIARQIAAHAKT